MRLRRTALVVPLVAGAYVAALTLPAAATLPRTAAQIPVSAGSARPVDLLLHPAAQIDGRVFVHTPPHGIKPIIDTAPVVGATVRAYVGKTILASAVADAKGDYALKGLRLKPAGYRVCALATSATNKPTPTGVLSGCYKTGAWNGVSTPTTGTPVQVKTGKTTTANFALAKSAAIAGTILDSSSAPISGANVEAVNRSTRATFRAKTNTAGRYILLGLPQAAKGYTVCARSASLGAGTGYRATCYQSTLWASPDTFPAAATKVDVTVPKATIGIKITLPAGGEVSGTVTDNTSKDGIAGATVEVLTSGGFALGNTLTDSSGGYVLTGLPSGGGERVCVEPTRVQATGTSYPGQCWNGVDWNFGPLPAGTTPVNVTSGGTVTDIDFTLTGTTVAPASISGTVTAGANGKHLYKAEVDLFSAEGQQLKMVKTTKAGTYTFAHVEPGQAYTVCAQGAGATIVGAKTSQPLAWAPQCLKPISWDGGALPPGVTTITPTPGKSVKNINFALRAGGGITGRTRWLKTPATASKPAGYVQVAGASVYLYDAAGDLLAKTKSTSVSNGGGLGGGSGPTVATYRFIGLAPETSSSGYIVCFDGSYPTGKSTYLPGCFKNLAWSGPN